MSWSSFKMTFSTDTGYLFVGTPTLNNTIVGSIIFTLKLRLDHHPWVHPITGSARFNRHSDIVVLVTFSVEHFFFHTNVLPLFTESCTPVRLHRYSSKRSRWHSRFLLLSAWCDNCTTARSLWCVSFRASRSDAWSAPSSKEFPKGSRRPADPSACIRFRARSTRRMEPTTLARCLPHLRPSLIWSRT